MGISSIEPDKLFSEPAGVIGTKDGNISMILRVRWRQQQEVAYWPDLAIAFRELGAVWSSDAGV